MKRKGVGFLMQRLNYLLRLAVCFLLLAAVAINRDASFAGHDLQAGDSEPVEDLSNVIREGTDGRTIVSTTALTKDVSGYSGQVPLEIFMVNDVIDHIGILPNNEGADFIDATLRAGILSAWDGLTVEEALKKNVDAVSGATFTSSAIIRGAQRGFAYVTGVQDSLSTQNLEGLSGVKPVMVLLTLLSGLIVSFFIRTEWARMVQLLLNVIVLGFWTGNFVSLSKMTALIAHGAGGMVSLIPLILIGIAFLFPLFGKKGYYCAWVCPLGSLQEVAGKVPFRFNLPTRVVRSLDRFRDILWMLLLFVMWLGVGFGLLNYELFAFFLLRHAGGSILVAGICFTLLSTVINRPYCRFVCPTGAVMKWCSKTK